MNNRVRVRVRVTEAYRLFMTADLFDLRGKLRGLDLDETFSMVIPLLVSHADASWRNAASEASKLRSKTASILNGRSVVYIPIINLPMSSQHYFLFTTKIYFRPIMRKDIFQPMLTLFHYGILLFYE